MKKWIKRIVILLVVVVVAAIVGVVLFLDQAAKAGLEAGGTSALGVKTQVDKVSVGLLSSSVTLKQLRIGNPEGYKTDHLLTLGRGTLACSVRSFFGNEPHIREITLEQPELTIELRYKNLVPKSNIGDLISSLDSGKAARKEAPKEKAPEGQKTFRIDHIRIVGTKVRFHLLAGKTADVTLPDIELKELKNRDGTPLLMADIFRQVLSSMSVSAFQKAKGIVPDDVLKGFGTTLGSARQLIQGLGTRVTERMGKLGKEATGLIGDTGKEIGKGAAGVLKGTGQVGKGIVEGAGKLGTGVVKGAGGVVKGAGTVGGKMIKGTGEGAGKLIRGIFGKKKKPKEEPKKE